MSAIHRISVPEVEMHTKELSKGNPHEASNQ
jgi:hypothetical protein